MPGRRGDGRGQGQPSGVGCRRAPARSSPPETSSSRRPCSPTHCAARPRGSARAAPLARSVRAPRMPAMKSFLLLAGCALAAFLVPRPFRGGEEKTRGDVEHGRYLVLHVAMCVQCHSPRDDEGRILESRLLSGAAMPIRPPTTAADGWASPRRRGAGSRGSTDCPATRTRRRHGSSPRAGSVATDGG